MLFSLLYVDHYQCLNITITVLINEKRANLTQGFPHPVTGLGPCHGGPGSFKRLHLYQFSPPLSLSLPLSVSVSLGLPVVVTVWQLCAGQITQSLWSVSQLTIVANEGSRRAQGLAYWHSHTALSTSTTPLSLIPSPFFSLPYLSYIHPLHPPHISLLRAPTSLLCLWYL